MFHTRLLFIGLLLAALVFLLTCDDNAVDSSDKTPPDQITTLNTSGQPVDTVILGWLATGDDGTKGRATEYDIRYSTDFITDRNWDQATVVPDPPRPTLPGFYQHFTVHDLDSLVNYYFALNLADDVGNWSPLSNVTLEWIAPGDDSMSFTITEYVIRYSTDSITGENWDSALPVAELPAPMPPGEVQQLELDYPDLHQVYFFALKAADERGNWSYLSNVAARYPDTIAPGPITDLSVVNVDTTSVTLSWAAPGDDGYVGTARTYAVKYATDPITEENWASAAQVGFPDRAKTAGETEHFKLTGLQVNSAYYFAVKAIDESGNWSPLSNVADTITGDTTLILWTKVIDLPGDQTATGLAIGSDGSIMIAGVTGTYGNHDALLVKTDAEGNLLWQKTYGGGADDYATDIIATNDGCFAIAGVISSYGAGSSDAWLLKVDAGGNLLWEKTYGGESAEDAVSLTQTPDGGFVLVGGENSYGTSKGAYIVKTDASGTQEWHVERYGSNNCGDGYTPKAGANDVVITPDGNIAFAWNSLSYPYSSPGWYGEGSCGPPDYATQVSTVDISGNPGWSTRPYGPEWATVRAMDNFSSGDLIWAEAGYAVVKANSYGSVIWQIATGMTSTDFSDMLVNESDRAILVGRHERGYPSYSHDAYFLSMDANGNIRGEFLLASGPAEEMAAIKMNTDGDMIVVGTTSLDGVKDDILLVKLSRFF